MSTLCYVAYAGGLTLVEELATAIGRDNTTRGNEDEELKLYFSNWVHFDYVLNWGGFTIFKPPLKRALVNHNQYTVEWGSGKRIVTDVKQLSNSQRIHFLEIIYG